MDQVYTASTFDQTVNIFSDSACSVPSVTILLQGTYVTSNYTSSAAAKGKDIDSTRWMSQVRIRKLRISDRIHLKSMLIRKREALTPKKRRVIFYSRVGAAAHLPILMFR